MAEPACEPCGACCREAFDAVPVEDEDVVRLSGHPELIVTEEDGWRRLTRVSSPRRRGSRCALLAGGPGGGPPFRCRRHPLRPDACRDLEPGGEACITARRRVGLEPWPEGTPPDGPLVADG